MQRINLRDLSVNFNRETLGIALNDIYQAIDRLNSGQIIQQTITQAISSSSGGASAKTEYRSASVSVSSGAVTVTFSSAMSTTNYQVIAFLVDSEGAVTPLKSPTSKSLTGFSYTLDYAGILIYVAIATN